MNDATGARGVRRTPLAQPEAGGGEAERHGEERDSPPRFADRDLLPEGQVRHQAAEFRMLPHQVGIELGVGGPRGAGQEHGLGLAKRQREGSVSEAPGDQFEPSAGSDDQDSDAVFGGEGSNQAPCPLRVPAPGAVLPHLDNLVSARYGEGKVRGDVTDRQIPGAGAVTVHRLAAQADSSVAGAAAHGARLPSRAAAQDVVEPGGPRPAP